MSNSDTPRPFNEWTTDKIDRAEEAADTFGYHVMQYCRAEALKKFETADLPATPEEFREQITSAVDLALHNVMALLEGFWPTQAGPNHRVRYSLSICVSDMSRVPVERIEISPCSLDLPIGYWKWTNGNFR